MDALYVGLLRRHLASLLTTLGHPALAASLRELVTARFQRPRDSALRRAQQALDAAPLYVALGDQADRADDDLAGGVITRAGPIAAIDLSPDERRVLERLALRPALVGVERRVIKAAIGEDVAFARAALIPGRRQASLDRADAAGTWFVPLGAEPGSISNA
jgi:hypothetical protein